MEPTVEARGGSGGTRLIVLRHGPAEEEDPLRWPNDDLRPLSEDGKAELRHAARGLLELSGPIARIASSPAERARATAEILRDAAEKPPRLETWNELAPGSAAEPVLQRVAHLARSSGPYVVVGHAPTLWGLVGYALIGEAVPIARIARGGAACIDFAAEVRPGGGVLAWLLTRKQLSAIHR